MKLKYTDQKLHAQFTHGASTIATFQELTGFPDLVPGDAILMRKLVQKTLASVVTTIAGAGAWSLEHVLVSGNQATQAHVFDYDDIVDYFGSHGGALAAEDWDFPVHFSEVVLGQSMPNLPMMNGVYVGSHMINFTAPPVVDMIVTYDIVTLTTSEIASLI